MTRTPSRRVAPPRPSPLLSGLLVVLALAGSLSGCSSLGGTDEANFVVGDGTVVQIPAEERTDPIEIAGPSLEDEPIDLADLRGEVVVLNIWGSWCNPCLAEAPILKEASEQVDASFVGMSFRETSFENALAVERRFGIEYPTIADTGPGVLALGRYAPRSPPSTYVLDTRGRVAAVISGAITSAGTLEDVVEDVKADDG
ncbi:TlpA disulfide reductase family protein [Nocardioides sp.]|mgnify:CR=1 FL=1|uniref:TlpA family protein disulfide reductase n=1 Tax=Nocardioides sp. TaxID=35761 RepID=UPI000C8D6C4D|nr:TlpA disulfide reductase family protein [Nocardioides sp.]MAS54906.1 redoxin [Pimelobacter sp.]MDE0776573.1 TlpA disulfide reductase family protein [Nocardioides sp.]